MPINKSKNDFKELRKKFRGLLKRLNKIEEYALCEGHTWQSDELMVITHIFKKLIKEIK